MNIGEMVKSAMRERAVKVVMVESPKVDSYSILVNSENTDPLPEGFKPKDNYSSLEPEEIRFIVDEELDNLTAIATEVLDAHKLQSYVSVYGFMDKFASTELVDFGDIKKEILERESMDDWTQISPRIDIHVEKDNNEITISFYPVYDDDDGVTHTDTLNMHISASFKKSLDDVWEYRLAPILEAVQGVPSQEPE